MKVNNLGACFLLGVLLMALALGAGGCGGWFNPARGLAAPAEKIDQRLTDATSKFGFALLHELWEKKPDQNLLISPASVAMALAMTYNGAAGDTRAAMEDALRLQGMTREEINAAFADLKTILENPDPKVSLAIANSIWARAGVSFNQDFLDRNRRYFGAEVAELDFSLPGAAGTINRWVKEKTRGKIEEIVDDPIHPLTVLFLINAIHFKGTWTEQFDKKQTREIPFTLADGAAKQHPVMFQSGDYRYLQGEGFQAVFLPYGKNSRVGMYIFLPDPGRSLGDFYGTLSAENWARWMASFREMEGDIGLPRFKFDYEASLNEPLKALGMAAAFDPAAADFSGMRPVPPELFISEVKHKTFIEVNEEGTEAAAVTSVEMRVTALPQKFYLVADRPFFFAVVDGLTGAILFMGSLADPSQI